MARAVSAELLRSFAPVFDEVGADAVARERERRLPYAEVERLRDTGFTRVSLPREFGGGGADYAALFELLTELARRDPNLAHLFRSHFSFVDRTLLSAPSPLRDARLRSIADGAIHGNATFERGGAEPGRYATTLTRDTEGLRLDGQKYYSTGTLFADQISVAAQHGADVVSVIVSTTAPGVERVDDWAGFGQRMTGSGSTRFSAVRVDDTDVAERGDGPSHGTAFVQLVLLAVATGIARAVVDDAVRYVRTRTRVFSHGLADTAARDPLVQETVGDLSALSFAADAALDRAVAALSRSGAALARGDAAAHEAVAEAEAATTHAQLVILPAVLRASTELFEVGGASALASELALDRHWRNARTVASHNPLRYKARGLGAHLLTQEPLTGWWTSGES